MTVSLVDELQGAQPSPEAVRIAQRIPLVHFPASEPLHRWKEWGSIKSAVMRGESPPGDGMFRDLRASHVFAYAGPCCFSEPGDVGDAVMYFAAGSEQGMSGAVAPFDTGSLEPPDARLQPWASRDERERWGFVTERVNEFETVVGGILCSVRAAKLEFGELAAR
jgi:hypothetical protein